MSEPAHREQTQQRIRTAKRITGIDAARGLALIGMMAIHVLPETTEDFEPTVVWTLAAGTSAALFALLAGVGLALSVPQGTGARALKAARVSLALRAVAIAGIGLALGLIEIPAFVILSYYGAMFALAIPLLGLGSRALMACAAGFAVFGALGTWLLGDAVPDLEGYDPSFYFLFAAPGGSLGSLLFNGAYPAIPFMAYVCAGLAIGKLDLRSIDIQLRIFLTGLALSIGTALVSALLLGPLGGRDALASSMRDQGGAEAVGEVLIWGPDDTVSLDSGWWQLTLAPYSHSVFDLLNTLGVALAVLAVMLYLSDRLAWALSPLSIVGAMTLTLYTGHLLFLATGLFEEQPMLSLWVQLGAGLLFAVLWKNVTGFKRGPLEHSVALLASGARDRVLEEKNRPA